MTPTPAPAASLSGVDREELARAIGMAKLRLAILSHTNPEVSAIAAKMPNLDFDNVWRKNVSYIQEDSLAAADAAIAYFLSHFATERKSPWRPIAEHDGSDVPVLLYRPDQGVFEGRFWAAQFDYESGVSAIWWSSCGQDLSPPDLMPTHFRPHPDGPTAPQPPAEGQ